MRAEFKDGKVVVRFDAFETRMYANGQLTVPEPIRLIDVLKRALDDREQNVVRRAFLGHDYCGRCGAMYRDRDGHICKRRRSTKKEKV